MNMNHLGNDGREFTEEHTGILLGFHEFTEHTGHFLDIGTGSNIALNCKVTQFLIIILVH